MLHKSNSDKMGARQSWGKTWREVRVRGHKSQVTLPKKLESAGYIQGRSQEVTRGTNQGVTGTEIPNGVQGQLETNVDKKNKQTTNMRQ